MKARSARTRTGSARRDPSDTAQLDEPPYIIPSTSADAIFPLFCGVSSNSHFFTHSKNRSAGVTQIVTPLFRPHNGTFILHLGGNATQRASAIHERRLLSRLLQRPFCNEHFHRFGYYDGYHDDFPIDLMGG